MNPSVSALSLSNHCASSTMSNNGRCSAAAVRSVSEASPTRNGSGTVSSLIPNAARSARACGAGNESRPMRNGVRSWCRPANPNRISDSMPTMRTTSKCVADAAAASSKLVGAIPPLMLKTAENPDGTPLEVFDDLRAKVLADRSQLYRDLAAPFYGANRPASDVSQGTCDQFWLMGMQVGLRAAFDCIRQFSESDFHEDLPKIHVPTLIIHGDDDQIVPIDASARLAAQLVPDAELREYRGASHGLFATHVEQFNRDLLEFIKR
jgi:hypothetical protein